MYLTVTHSCGHKQEYDCYDGTTLDSPGMLKLKARKCTDCERFTSLRDVPDNELYDIDDFGNRID